MAKKEKNEPQKLNLFDKEYLLDDLTDEQKTMVNHIADLENKIKGTAFNLDQLNVGKEAFINRLQESLESEQEEEAEAAKAEADAARERGAQYDKAELEMLTEQYKQSLGPDKLQIANALVEDSRDENGVPTLSLVDALAMTGKSTQTKFGEYLGALKDAYPNANVGFLANVAGSSAFLKGFIDQYGMEGLTQALGQAVTTQDLNVLQNAQGSAAENKGDQSGGSGITIEPIE